MNTLSAGNVCSSWDNAFKQPVELQQSWFTKMNEWLQFHYCCTYTRLLFILSRYLFHTNSLNRNLPPFLLRRFVSTQATCLYWYKSPKKSEYVSIIYHHAKSRWLHIYHWLGCILVYQLSRISRYLSNCS